MAKKFLDNTGLSHLINLIQGMPDDQTIGYTTEAGLHVLDGSITPNKISSLQQLRYEMGLGNTLGALPIENGGTGLTSEAAIKEWLESLLDLSGGGGGGVHYGSFSYSFTRATNYKDSTSHSEGQLNGFTAIGANGLICNQAGTYTIEASARISCTRNYDYTSMNAGFSIDGVSYPVVTHAVSHTSYSANDTYSLTTYVNNGAKITGYVGITGAAGGATTNASGSVSVSLVTSS